MTSVSSWGETLGTYSEQSLVTPQRGPKSCLVVRQLCWVAGWQGVVPDQKNFWNPNSAGLRAGPEVSCFGVTVLMPVYLRPGLEIWLSAALLSIHGEPVAGRSEHFFSDTVACDGQRIPNDKDRGFLRRRGPGSVLAPAASVSRMGLGFREDPEGGKP